MSYIVLETHPGYAVLLDEEGRFVKAANMNYETGETVTDVFLIKDDPTSKKKFPAWAYTIAAMAACLVVMAAFLVRSFISPYASVYISINPRVRIDVNKQDIVVGVEGVNDDGILLLEGYDYRNKDLDLVVDELVDLAIAHGYLHEGGKITLTLDANDDWVVSHSEHLTQQISHHLADKYTITIDIGASKEPADTASSHHEEPASSSHSSHRNDTDYHDSDYGIATNSSTPDVTEPDTDYSEPPVTSGHTDYGDTDYSEPAVTSHHTDHHDTDYDQSTAASSAQEAPTSSEAVQGESNYSDTDYGVIDEDDDLDDDYEDEDSDEDEGSSDYED